MKYIISLFFLCMSVLVNAQSKTTIAEKRIHVIRTLEQDINQGEKKLLLEKEECFNNKGELVEMKEFDGKGRIKKWEQYKYSTEGKLIEEKKLNYKGDLKKRIVHLFKNGLRVEKQYFDERNRLYKKKKYEFVFE